MKIGEVVPVWARFALGVGPVYFRVGPVSFLVKEGVFSGGDLEEVKQGRSIFSERAAGGRATFFLRLPEKYIPGNLRGWSDNPRYERGLGPRAIFGEASSGGGPRGGPWTGTRLGMMDFGPEPFWFWTGTPFAKVIQKTAKK